MQMIRILEIFTATISLATQRFFSSMVHVDHKMVGEGMLTLLCGALLLVVADRHVLSGSTVLALYMRKSSLRRNSVK